MWNIFKFFFVWFWLALASFSAFVLIAPKPPERIVLVRGKHVSVPGKNPAAEAGVMFGFIMCIPSYFIARPKRA